MHEAGLMESALSIAERQAKEARATEIHSIRLRVGRLSGIVPEALEMAFAVLRRGTMAGNATMEIEQVAGVCFCGECRREFETSGLLAECPECRTPSADVRRGLELEIVSMEVC